MTATLVERIRETAVKKSDAAEAAYWQLVRDSANEKPVDSDKAYAVLEAAGIDAERFSADADLIARRFADAKLAAAGAAAEVKRLGLVDELEKAEAAFTPHRAKFEEAERRIAYERGRALEAIGNATAAESRLFANCPYPRLRRRQAELTAAVHATHGELKDLREEIERLRREQSNRIGKRNSNEYDWNLERLQAETDARLQKLTPGLAPLEAELARLHAELDGLVVEMRLP